MDLATLFGSTLGLVFFVFCFVLAMLWILVPFAIFGIKPFLKQIVAEQRRTNDLLTGMAQRQQIVSEAYLSAPLPTAQERPAPPPL